jgi:hypothetical protein
MPSHVYYDHTPLWTNCPGVDRDFGLVVSVDEGYRVTLHITKSTSVEKGTMQDYIGKIYDAATRSEIDNLANWGGVGLTQCRPERTPDGSLTIVPIREFRDEYTREICGEWITCEL